MWLLSITLLLGALLARREVSPPLIPISQSILKVLQFSAKFSVLPYCNASIIKTGANKYFNSTSLENFQLNSVRDIVWLTAYDRDTNQIVLTYRASYTLKNWLQNAELELERVPGAKNVKMHKGWLKGARLSLPKLEAQLMGMINNRSYAAANILFVGHSSAASLGVTALYLALHEGGFLYKKFPTSRITIVTIGGPRLGNVPFARYFDSMGWKAVYRLVRGSDPIPYWYMPLT
jgi:Lipase (class 3)